MQLDIDDQGRERKAHGDHAFPLRISDERLSRYERSSFLWHWHPEVELTYVVAGRMRYQVNGAVYQLEQGQGLFCNANALHTGGQLQGDCAYAAITFHPRLVYGSEGSRIHTRYVMGLADSAHLPGDAPWQLEALSQLHAVYRLGRQQPPGYELAILSQLAALYGVLSAQPELRAAPAADPALDRVRALLGVIRARYAHPLTLQELAASVNLSRSECCRLFKRHMGQSLFTYLLDYRVERSLPLLAAGERSVTEVAGEVGFASPSYFAQVFKARMGCPPGAYRREARGLDSGRE